MLIPMKRIFVRLFVVSIAGLGACNPFAPDQSVVLDVESLDAPATIATGASLTVVLTVTTGGCIVFDHITALRGTSGAQLVAIGRNTAKGRPNVSCPTDIRTDPHSYTLNPPFDSPFTVTVDRGGLSPLTATVVVQ